MQIILGILCFIAACNYFLIVYDALRTGEISSVWIRGRQIKVSYKRREHPLGFSAFMFCYFLLGVAFLLPCLRALSPATFGLICSVSRFCSAFFIPERSRENQYLTY